MSNDDTRYSIILGVSQQDPERWREFDAIYRPILTAYLRKRGLKESEANDLVQDIFVKLLGKIHTYDRGKCSFRNWLFTVAQNALIDDARKRTSSQKAVAEWAQSAIRYTPSDSVSMHGEFIDIHREQILDHALQRVRSRTSTKVWACFEQRLLKERPATVIAAELDVEPHAVYVYASRVLKQVRAVCKKIDEDMSRNFEVNVP
jgi:RNA polymerase sigma factor (sigma-70 family)